MTTDVRPSRGALEEGDDSVPPQWRVPAALFFFIALLMGGDLVLDAFEGAHFAHLLMEALVLLLAGAGIAHLLRQVVVARRSVRALRGKLSAARADAARWQSEARAVLDGLGAAIDAQFSQWSLSSAEREIALLLLKGLPLREIAALRGTSERTVRQQAFGLYRKAGVEGRADLSAFFLEDLLLPTRS